MEKIISFSKYCFPILALILFPFCNDDTTTEPPPAYTYEVPEKINDGWETANLSEVGMTSENLISLVDLINYRIFNEIHSVLIVKDNKLVFEEYFPGHKFDYNGNNHKGFNVDFNRTTNHNQASVTKSFASALVGIAIDKGFISGIHQKVSDFFPEYSKYFVDEKLDMTLEHLLTMTSGLDWNEWEVTYGNSTNDLIRMCNFDDPFEYLVSKPLSNSPGKSFYYNSGCTNLLGEIVYRATNIKPEIFADENLFNKLGILSKSWQRFHNGTLFVSGDLRIRPRDMAKFGYLYLNDGAWNGEQIISENWINNSKTEFIEVNDIWHYGYQWWLRNYNVEDKSYKSFSARGWGGQQITVFPELDMVLVFTGGNYSEADPVDQIILEYVLTSIL